MSICIYFSCRSLFSLRGQTTEIPQQAPDIFVPSPFRTGHRPQFQYAPFSRTGLSSPSADRPRRSRSKPRTSSSPVPSQQDTTPNVDVHFSLMLIPLVPPRKSMDRSFTAQSSASESAVLQMGPSVVASEVRHAGVLLVAVVMFAYIDSLSLCTEGNMRRRSRQCGGVFTHAWFPTAAGHHRAGYVRRLNQVRHRRAGDTMEILTGHRYARLRVEPRLQQGVRDTMKILTGPWCTKRRVERRLQKGKS